MTPAKRKGARSINEIPPDTLKQLNNGKIETANLVEWLAVDQNVLLKNFLRQSGRQRYLLPILKEIAGLKKQTVNTINEAIGAGLLAQAIQNNDPDLLALISTHCSDMVRCWATYSIGKNHEWNMRQVFDQIKPFAADKHFGVREISWLAVRSRISKNLEESIGILSGWAREEDENIRRFASESTRPRGVWCEHIEVLKQDPRAGLNILEPLKSDQSKYVQNSVGNWLNDASKTQPKFVVELCKRWEKESNSKETACIISKALRTLAR
jgi:3-methyladenine DNA glycosylase AlkC